MRSMFLLAAPALTVSSPVAAAPPEPPAEIIITASRLSSTAAESPYSVRLLPERQVIGRSEIGDALSDLAEVYVQSPGGRSGTSALFLRGADPNFTAVLFDGVPLNNPASSLGGAVDVGDITAASIGRVELVTGPLSSLYGSGALAGVVNLIVPAGSDRSTFEAVAGAGTAGDKLGLLRWRGPVGAVHGGSVTLLYDDGGEDPGSARFKTSALIAKFATRDREDAGRVVVRLSDTDARGFPDASGGPELAAIRTLEERHGREALIGASQPVLRSGPWRIDLSGSFLRRRDRTISPGVASTENDPVGVPSGEDDTRYRRVGGQVAGRFERGGWQAVGGVEAQHEVARSQGFLDFFGQQFPTDFRQNRWTRSAFAEASRTANNLLVNVGGRLDRVDGLGSELTGRAGLLYRLDTSGLSVRANAGTGFKAPSFYALGNPFVGNPGLRPERSRSVEAGVDFAAPGGLILSLTAFRTRYAGLIDFVPDPVPRLENRSLVISKGVSASIASAPTRPLFASVQVQYAATRDRDSGEFLLNRPRWRTSSMLTYRALPGLTFTVRHRFVDRRLSFAVPTGVAMLSAYHTVSLESELVTGAGQALRFVIDNALDSDAEDAVGFPVPGRRARVLLQKRF